MNLEIINKHLAEINHVLNILESKEKNVDQKNRENLERKYRSTTSTKEMKPDKKYALTIQDVSIPTLKYSANDFKLFKNKDKLNDNENTKKFFSNDIENIKRIMYH